mgnify:CR=1 FL=1
MRVQGFYFTRRRTNRTQAFTAAFLPSMQFYTASAQKLLHSFTGAFPFIRRVLPLLYNGVSLLCCAAYKALEDTPAHKAPPAHTRDTTAAPDAVQLIAAALL